MKTNQTKNTLSVLGIFMAVAFCSLQVNAQRFIINSPASIAGEYVIEAANFGQVPITGEYNGDFVLANDPAGAIPTEACDALDNGAAIAGNFALIDRGACEFGDKCLNAETAGAQVAIVCNNVDNDGTVLMGGGVNGGSVTIPCISMSKEDCAIIKAEMANGPVSGTLADAFNFNNDLALGSTSNATSAFTPSRHAQPIQGFAGTVSNVGLLDQTNVNCEVEITNSQGAVVHTDNALFDILPAGYIDSTFEMSANYSFPPCVEDYEVKFSVSADAADELALDNETTFNVGITDNMFAKHSNVTGAATPNGVTSYEFGNFYELLAPDSAVSCVFTVAKNGTDPPLDGQFLTLYLFEVTGPLDNTFSDASVNPVAVAFYSFDATSENFDDFEAEWVDYTTFAPGPIALNAGLYLCMVSVVDDGNGTIFTGYGDQTYFPGQLGSVIRTGGALGDGTDTWNLAGFADAVAYCNLKVTNGTDPACFTGITNPEPLNATLDLFPNPAVKYLSMGLELPTGVTEAEVIITNLQGQLITRQQINNPNMTQVYDVENFAAGTYFFTVVADDKILTKKFTVVK